MKKAYFFLISYDQNLQSQENFYKSKWNFYRILILRQVDNFKMKYIDEIEACHGPCQVQ